MSPYRFGRVTTHIPFAHSNSERSEKLGSNSEHVDALFVLIDAISDEAEVQLWAFYDPINPVPAQHHRHLYNYPPFLRDLTSKSPHERRLRTGLYGTVKEKDSKEKELNFGQTD